MTDSQRCAAAVIAQLLAQGVQDFVVCPGSRSAPLALAALSAEGSQHYAPELGDAFPIGRTRLHMRIDERSAGFLALGLAKSGHPTAVIVTSGTAVGNLLPAVMEASHSQVPLVVITADRPASLVGFGANQTTDQRGVFARFVRWETALDSAADSRSWAAQSARAVLLATGRLGGIAGPVHMNVHLDIPLAGGGTVRIPETKPVRVEGKRQHDPLLLRTGKPTIVLAGDGNYGNAALHLAEEARIPLIAEPSSNSRRGQNALSCGRVLLSSRLAKEVQRVVVFGHPTLSRSVHALLSRRDVEVIVVGNQEIDPGWNAAVFTKEVSMLADDQPWLARWRSNDDLVSTNLRQILAKQPQLTGQTLAKVVTEQVGEHGTLFLGNSNVIRDADIAPIANREIHWWQDFTETVFANRGLAGIDGIISTAIGVALRRQRTTLLCGDLTFLHDSNALVISRAETVPDLRIVVADDRGGSIFATLEYGAGEYWAQYDRVFAVPPPTDLVALAQAHGVPATRVDNLAALEAALRRPIRGIEVLVVDIDRSRRHQLTAQVESLAHEVG